MKTFLLCITVLYGFQYAIGQNCTATITANGPTTFCEGSVLLTANTYGGKNWVQKTSFGGGVRYRAASFSIGDKGYVGIGMDNGQLKGDFWGYNPANDTWTQKANFAGGPRQGAVGFAIGSKGYIGTGDDYNPGNKKDFWEYDPAANSWTQKANFGGSDRYEASGFSIGNKGYIGLGNTNSFYLKDFWEYDPVLDQWTQMADYGGSSRSGATGFSIGSKGYLGTGYDGSVYNDDFWEFDPAINTWTQKANLGGAGRSFAIGFAISNKGYLGTGYTPGNTYEKDFWEYDPLTNTWLQLDNPEVLGRLVAFGFSIGNKGYMGGGNSEQGLENDFWEYFAGNSLSYRWSTGEKTQSVTVTTTGQYVVSITNSAGCIATSDPVFVNAGPPQKPTITANGPTNFCEGGSLVLTANPKGGWAEKADFEGLARSNSSGFTIGNKGYIGIGGNNAHVNIDFWEYDPSTNVWSQKADFEAGPLNDAVGFSIGNKGYIGTGYSPIDGFHNDFWEYDPLSNTWARKADFAGPPRAGATGLSIGSKGYIGLGFHENGNCLDDFWEYDPAINSWTKKAKFEGGARKTAVGFSIAGKGYIGTGRDFNNNYPDDFWEYDPVADSWIKKGNFPGIERERGVGFSIFNKGYIGTGITNNFQNDFWEYFPNTNTWTRSENFPGAPRIWATAFSIGDRGYIGLGYGYSGVHNDFWEFNPSGIDPVGNAFYWSTGETTPNITVSKNGNYNVTVSNSAGCTAKSDPVVVTVTAHPTFSTSVINAGCNNAGNGSIIITAEGGNDTYLYSIDNGIHYNSNNIFSGLPAAIYPVVVLSNGCISKTQYVTVKVNNQLSLDCPGNMVMPPATLQGTIVNYPLPVVDGGCPPVSLLQISGLASGAVFPIGITTNIYKTTDGAGNYASCNFTITVTDPYCSEATGNKKVYVCHKGETICVSVNALRTHLDHGDYLGACSSNYAKTAPQTIPAGIEVFPNPSHGRFTLKLSNLKASNGLVTIMDSKGAIIETRRLYKTLFPETINFDLGNIAYGNYRVKVETKLETFSAMVVLQ